MFRTYWSTAVLSERGLLLVHTHACGNTHAHRPLGYHYFVLDSPIIPLLSAFFSRILFLYLSFSHFSQFFTLVSLPSRFCPCAYRLVHRIHGTDVVSFFFQCRSSLRRAFDILNPVITSVCHRFLSPRKESSSFTCPCVILHNSWFWACFSLCAVHSVHLHPQRCIYFSTLNITVFCTLVKKKRYHLF